MYINDPVMVKRSCGDDCECLAKTGRIININFHPFGNTYDVNLKGKKYTGREEDLMELKADSLMVQEANPYLQIKEVSRTYNGIAAGDPDKMLNKMLHDLSKQTKTRRKL